MIHRTYDFSGYSPLDQINRSNVGQLKLAWMRAMDSGPQEIRPLVYDGVMYIAHPGGDHIQALDATTGDLIWDYKRQLPEDIREYSGAGNRTRNLAIYDNKIYHLTWDAFIVALHAVTGEVVWETRTADYRQGITHSSGAMIIKGMVVSGSCLQFPVWRPLFLSPLTMPKPERNYGAPTQPPARGNLEETPGETCPMKNASTSLPGVFRAAMIRSWT